jgi:hypothetical protein
MRAPQMVGWNMPIKSVMTHKSSSPGDDDNFTKQETETFFGRVAPLSWSGDFEIWEERDTVNGRLISRSLKRIYR